MTLGACYPGGLANWNKRKKKSISVKGNIAIELLTDHDGQEIGDAVGIADVRETDGGLAICSSVEIDVAATPDCEREKVDVENDAEEKIDEVIVAETGAEIDG